MRYTITTSYKLRFLLAFEHITKITKGNMLTKSNLLIRIIFVILFKCIVAFSYGQANVQQIGPNYFVAGVSTEKFNWVAANSRQRANNWCWAACIQMVLNYHGLYITQEDIVRQCYGGLYDKPGGYEEFALGLNRWAYNNRGSISKVSFNSYPTNSNEIVNFLSSNWPLIVGINTGGDVGHAYVLTAIYYSIGTDQYGNTIALPEKVVLRDPSPGQVSPQEWPWQTFANHVTHVYKVWVSDIQPTYYSYAPLVTWDDLFPQTSISDRGYAKNTLYSGFSFTSAGTSFPIIYEKELSKNNSIRYNIQLAKKSSSDGYAYSFTRKYFGMGVDYLKNFPRPYRWNWFAGGTLNYRIHSLTQTTYDYNGRTYLEKTKMNHLFAGIRAGGVRYSGKKCFITWDMGMGYHTYFRRIKLDMNVLIGYRF